MMLFSGCNGLLERAHYVGLIVFMQNQEHSQEVTKQEVMSSHETNNIFFTNEVDKG